MIVGGGICTQRVLATVRLKDIEFSEVSGSWKLTATNNLKLGHNSDNTHGKHDDHEYPHDHPRYIICGC